MLMGSLLALLESWLNKTQLLDIHVLGILVIFGMCFYFSIAFFSGFLPAGLLNSKVAKH